MKNERGMITLDFLFAFILVFGLTILLFRMSFTMSVASVVQYITFSAARNYSVANIDKAKQEERGQAKYHELINNDVFKPLFSSGWFKVSKDAKIGDHTLIISDYVTAAEDKNQFWGVGTDFVPKILEFKIAFFGSSDPDGDGSGSNFKTYMASYMGREVTTEECLEFTKERWRAIRKLAVSSGAPYSSGTSDSGYYTMTDDGC